MHKLFLFSIVFLFAQPGIIFADTVYFKNGRQMQGLIKSESEDALELEICLGGRVEYKKAEIERIERSTAEEALRLRQKWQEESIESQKRQVIPKAAEDNLPRQIKFAQDSQGIAVKARLNNKLDVLLTLDTGATVVVFKRDTARRLGIDVNSLKTEAKLTLADGSSVAAKFLLLESVKVEGLEAKDVEAVVMLEEVAGTSWGEGLLGMSFLKRFNFKVDNKNKKLVLERLS
jgi:clan AA aspartic protease (TIGR02281 family)